MMCVCINPAFYCFREGCVCVSNEYLLLHGGFDDGPGFSHHTLPPRGPTASVKIIILQHTVAAHSAEGHAAIAIE